MTLQAVLDHLEGNKGKYNFYFAHGVCIITFNLIGFITFELFAFMSWKCRHYTPGSRFQTANPEN